MHKLLDKAVGRVLDALKREGYYDDTMVWMTTDNGPEGKCGPMGFCKGTEHRPHGPQPGSAGPLRGRKRDIYEGGHRVPGIVSWPREVQDNRESWDTVVTMDFLATIMDVLDVERPAKQADWHFDGGSIMPILRGESWPERSIGWMFHDATMDLSQQRSTLGYGFRYGDWKYVVGSHSCQDPECQKLQLFNLKNDLGEREDLSARHPSILEAIKQNFTAWYNSVQESRAKESKCKKAIGWADELLV